MTKKEMMEHLDGVMMINLESAIRCADRKLEYCANNELEAATGVLLSTSALGLLSDEEFKNINHCLSYTSMRFCR